MTDTTHLTPEQSTFSTRTWANQEPEGTARATSVETQSQVLVRFREDVLSKCATAQLTTTDPYPSRSVIPSWENSPVPMVDRMKS